ncbi:MAG: ABC transporter permease [Pseudomonadota bacterium]
MIGTAPLRFASFRATGALVLREIATSFGRSPGGYIWAVLEPVAVIGLLSLVFSAALNAPSLGRSFALFYASGFLPFLLFMDVVNKLTTALFFSRPLLEFPAVTFADALLGRFILNVVTHLLVGMIVFSAIFALFETATILRPASIALAYGMAASFAFGLGVFNCLMHTTFPVWMRLWQIGARPLFIISGIFFIYEDVPFKFREYLWWNPLLHITSELRRGIYVTYEPNWVSPAFVFSLSLVLSVIGFLFLRRYQSELLLK